MRYPKSSFGGAIDDYYPHEKRFSDMGLPCIESTVDVQGQSRQFACLHESSLSSSRVIRNWPVKYEPYCQKKLGAERKRILTNIKTTIIVLLHYLRPYIPNNSKTQFLTIEILIEVVEQPWFLHALQTRLETERESTILGQYCTHYGLLGIVEVWIPTNAHDKLVNASC